MEPAETKSAQLPIFRAPNAYAVKLSRAPVVTTTAQHSNARLNSARRCVDKFGHGRLRRARSAA